MRLIFRSIMYVLFEYLAARWDFETAMCAYLAELHVTTSRGDKNSGYKYSDPPGTLNYRETGGSNQVEVQIRVDKPSQHPQPSTTVATARDKQSNLNSAKISKTRSLHNKIGRASCRERVLLMV